LFTPKFHFVTRRGRPPHKLPPCVQVSPLAFTFFSKKFYNWSLLQIEQFLRNLTHRFTWLAVTLTVRIALNWGCICDASRHVPTCTDLFQSAHCLLFCLGRYIIERSPYLCVTVILLLNGCDVYRIIDQLFGSRQKCRNRQGGKRT